MKLRGAVEENNSITQEIAGMKVTLMKLQTERVKAGGRAAHEVDAALAKVILQRHLLLSRQFLYMLTPPDTHALLESDFLSHFVTVQNRTQIDSDRPSEPVHITVYEAEKSISCKCSCCLPMSS